jgi:hypothetical protein
MFDENSQSNLTDPRKEMQALGGQIKTGYPANLSEEDMVELLGSWNLLTTFTLLDIPGFQLTPENVSSRLGQSLTEAENSIESLERLGVIRRKAETKEFESNPLFFTNAMVSSADLLNIFNRLSQISSIKLTSKDNFGCQFEVLSKKVIVRNLPDIFQLFAKMAQESKGEDDCEVYSCGFSFAKASRGRKDK